MAFHDGPRSRDAGQPHLADTIRASTDEAFLSEWRKLKASGIVRLAAPVSSGGRTDVGFTSNCLRAAFLIADVILLTGITKAADVVGEPSVNTKVLRHATSALYLRERNCRWRSGRHYRWAAPSALVAGMRDTSPLTVPFFGSNWYPGPVHYYYYGPPAGHTFAAERIL
jgi:hypothetical protein